MSLQCIWKYWHICLKLLSNPIACHNFFRFLHYRLQETSHIFLYFFNLFFLKSAETMV